MRISRREGEVDDAGDMRDNCFRGLESTAHSNIKTDADYLGRSVGGWGDAWVDVL